MRNNVVAELSACGAADVFAMLRTGVSQLAEIQHYCVTKSWSPRGAGTFARRAGTHSGACRPQPGKRPEESGRGRHEYLSHISPPVL